MYQSNSNSSMVCTPTDTQLKDLLHIHRNKFSQVDVENLIPFLKETGQLNQDEIESIRRSSGQKIQALLDLIPTKGSQAFQTLCLALENTSPHLLTVLLMAFVQRPQSCPSRQGSLSTGLTSDSECEEKKSNASSGGDLSGGKNGSPTQGTLISSHDFYMEQSNVALLKAELKIVTKDRDVMKKELKKVSRERDEFANRCTLTDQSSNYSTLNSTAGDNVPGDWDSLRVQYERALSEMQSIKKQNLELSRKYDTALKDIEFYRNEERTAYKALQGLRLQFEEISSEKQKLEHEMASLQTIVEDDRKEIAELRRQQQENRLSQQSQEAMTQDGSGEAINQIYVSTLRKYEELKEEYDSLHKRYADIASSHSNYANKLELAQQDAIRWKKNCDKVNRDRVALKHQCTEAILQWGTEIRERKLIQAELVKMKDKHRDAVKDMDEQVKQRQTLSKDVKRLQEERNAAMQEYTLVMSERDTVHKEMDKLQEELGKASKTIKSIETTSKDSSKEKESLQLQLETLKREIASSLHDRDKAVRELMEFKERYGAPDDTKKEWDHSYKDYDTIKLERDHKSKENSDQGITGHDLYSKTHKERHENLDQANQEIDRLRKTVDKLQSELQEAKREAELSKRRRDWAFGERDKIVLERESIRAHCDKLRHERDRAVSDLAEALRDSDDMTKQRNEAEKQLKELKERLENEQEKCVSTQQLTGHNNSRDSAIDTELHEWDLEAMHIPINKLTHRDIGFEICGGSDDPHYGSTDGAVFVSSVNKDGPFYGKLRIHDQLVRVNGIECQGVTRASVAVALFSSGSWAHITVRRRKSNHYNLHTAHIHCGHVNHGIVLHNGIYIGSILPGSPAAKEGSLSPGDKVMKISGRLVDNTLTADGAMSLMDVAGEIIQLTILKAHNAMSAPLSSSSSGHNITEDDKSLSSRHYSSPTSISKESSASPARIGPRDFGLKLPLGIATSYIDETKKLGSNEKVIYNVTKGTEDKVSGAWDQFKSIVRPRRHSKERFEFREKQEKVKSPCISEQEKALAELDLVIDSYKCNKSNTKRSKKKEKSGGTWPKYRRNPPNLREIHSGTIKPSQWKKQEPPLSMYLPATLSDTKAAETIKKNTLPRNFASRLTNPRSHVLSIYNSSDNSSFSIQYNSNDYATPYPRQSSETYPNQDIYCTLSTRNPDHKEKDNHSPDTSLDFSVKSGNVGQEELEYYVKKNRGHFPPSDSEKNLLETQPSSLPPAYMSRASPLLHLSDKPTVHLHANYANASTPLRVTPTFPFSQYSHYHQHNSSPIYSSPYATPPLAPNYMTPSRSGELLPELDGRFYSNPSPYGSAMGFPQPASTSIDSGGMRCKHPHTARASSDEPPNILQHPGPPYRDYRLTVATMPRIGSHSSVQKKTLTEHGCDGMGDSTSTLGNPSFSRGLANCMTSQSGSSLNKGSQPITEIFYSVRSPHVFRPVPKPNLMELRKIVLEKEKEPLGIQIRCLESGGVFVASVSMGSLAEQVGLCVGDQLLDVCGINMRSAQKSVAQTVLSQLRTSVIMLVQYNPEKYQDTDLWEQCSSGGSMILGSRANSPTPRSSPIEPQTSSHDSEEDLHSGSSTLRSPLDYELTSSARSTLTRAQVPTMLSIFKQDNEKRRSTTESTASDQRKIFVEMSKGQNIGIQMVGGNAFGIFVHSVIPDSPADKSGLRPGDQILEYNGVDLRQATAEYAAFELAKPAENVDVVIAHDWKKYTDIKDKPGDSFYIKALVGRQEVCEQNELKFNRDDILFVDNTMYGNMPGLWRAWILGPQGEKKDCGIIPSKDKIEEDMLTQKNVDRRGITPTRRSFFRRKKHSRSSSRDSKELASFSDASLNGYTSSQEDTLSYMRVEKLWLIGPRPILIVGPLWELVGEKLCSDLSQFYQCSPLYKQCSQEEIDQGMRDLSIIDYRRRADCYEITYAKQVEQLRDRGVHGVLDINLSAVERLHRLNIHPIVLMLKFKHYKHIRDISDTHYPTPDRLSQKEAKEMFDLTNKLELEYKHLVSAVINACNNMAYICSQVEHLVEKEQSKIIWIPSGILC